MPSYHSYYKQIPISKDYLFPVMLEVLEDNFAFTFRLIGENKETVDHACEILENAFNALKDHKSGL